MTLSDWLSAPSSSCSLASAVSPAAGDPTDPVRNVALPCEAVSTPGLVARASRASPTSRTSAASSAPTSSSSRGTDLAGKVHDYAFVGTMGAGLRIFDVTDPAHPMRAGGYVDPGWENDVQVARRHRGRDVRRRRRRGLVRRRRA